jgi:prepilin-type N-terminal cleavage/methylation domain-containing protein
MTRRCSGNTLLELLVVLAILGIAAGVTGLSFGRGEATPAADSVEARIAEARREAVRSGKSVTVNVSRGGDDVLAATAHPDGRVVADSVLAIDRFSGRRIR